MDKDQYGIQGAYVILAMSVGLYMLAKPFFAYLLRRRLMDLGQWNEKSHRELSETSHALHDTLKWGIILLYTGVGLIIAGLLPYSYQTSGLPYGVVVVSASLGFLTYYLIASRNRDRS